MLPYVIDATEDACAWERELARLPENLRDIYFRPEYVALHCFTPGSRPLLFVFAEADNVWLYSFILQPIPAVGSLRNDGPWFDIESPYGYSGPLSNTDDQPFLAAAYRAFSEWCAENGVVAEFIRLHPLLQNQRWLDPQIEVVYDRPTVSLNLAIFSGLDPAELPFESTSRYMLRRAQRGGVYVEPVPVSDCFDEFVKLYKDTMAARNATAYYYFTDQYFDGLKTLVGKTGWLLAAKRDGESVGAAIFLRGTEYIHYHLSADGVHSRTPGATNLLLYEAARRASEAGHSRLHLGGGTTAGPNDTLLKFKRSMSTDAHSFYIGKRVHDRKTYDALKQEWERTHPALARDYGNRLLCYRIGNLVTHE